MAIDYLEIRDINREIIGIVDTAKSVIWHSVYFGVGDFEIYAPATQSNLSFLQVGAYVTRIDDLEVGIIESINITDSLQDGTMITATGRFAKSMLDRRQIYNLSGNTNTPTILKGNVETAVRQVVSNNAINCSFDSGRNIPVLELGTLSNINLNIVDENGKAAEKQVSYQNLLEYTDGVLQEYGLSAIVCIDFEKLIKKLQYKVIQGVDRSVDNANGLDPVIFSKDFDNLVSSEYSYNTTTEKNAVLIGGEGEGLARFYSLIKPSQTGLARRETWLDASSLNKTVKKDDLQANYPNGTFSGNNFVVAGVTIATKIDPAEEKSDYTYTNAVYSGMLNSSGKQTLAQLNVTETFDGTLNVTTGNYRLNRDFFLGDIVTVEEKSINKYINVRIAEVTEVQDENGYTVEAKYI